MSQPPGAPPEQWERRKTDERGHLALVAGLNDVTKELRALDVREAKNTDAQRLDVERNYVSYKALYASIVALLVLNLGAMAWFGTQAEKAITATRADNIEARKEMSTWREAWDKRLEWVLRQIDGSSHFQEEKPTKGRR